MSAVSVKTVETSDWGECVRLSNGDVELLVATEIGPRIVRFGFEGGRNEFQTYPEGQTDFPVFGGHRLWHSPEDSQRTHVPDDSPVEYDIDDGSVRVTRSTDPQTFLRRELEIYPASSGTAVDVVHRIHNEGAWPIEFAPWALTVLRPGGEAILPFRRQAPSDSLLHDRSLQLWPYTHLADDRFRFEPEYLGIEQRDQCDGPIKVGTSVGEGWAAYVRDGHAFRKDFDVDPDGTYPDDGSTVEAYTRSGLLELETLGTKQAVAPGSAAEHVETWTLTGGIDNPVDVFDIEPTPVR